MPAHPQNNPILSEIRSDLESILNQKLLFEANQFSERADAIDFLDFHIIERIEGLLNQTNHDPELLILKKDALAFMHQLEKINDLMIKSLQEKIRKGFFKDTAFTKAIHEIMGNGRANPLSRDEPGYDNLDILIDSLFSVPGLLFPEESIERDSDMVFYQKTPARIVFELAQKANIKKNDVFYDLGSGLGQVPILMHLLTGVNAVGIEHEPQFCDYANAIANFMNLTNVNFQNIDAREVNYGNGTIFYFYTPFVGEILKEVLSVLKEDTRGKSIRIFTYGPCTDMVARENWLSSKEYLPGKLYTLTEFRSNN